MNMDAGLELELNLSRKELRVLLLHEYRLGRKTTEAARNMQYDGQGCTLNSYGATLVQSVQEW